jgi:hypothetical protein
MRDDRRVDVRASARAGPCRPQRRGYDDEGCAPLTRQRECDVCLPASNCFSDQAATIANQRTLSARDDPTLVVAQHYFAKLRGRQRIEADARNGGQRRPQPAVGA